MVGPGDDRRNRVKVGVVGRPHGVRGQVHIRSYTARPEDIAAYGPVETVEGRRLEIAVVAVNKADVTARITGLTDRNGAEALRGQELFVPRAALPETAPGEYYHHDLVGLRAESVAGEELGRVVAVEDFGAGPVLELERADGKGVYMPFTVETVANVDVVAGRITLEPPPGLMDGPPDGEVDDVGNEDGRQELSDER